MIWTEKIEEKKFLSVKDERKGYKKKKSRQN